MLSNSIFKDIVEYIKVIDFRFVKCSSVHIFIETYLLGAIKPKGLNRIAKIRYVWIIDKE
jgi:hypothetical protein